MKNDSHRRKPLLTPLQTTKTEQNAEEMIATTPLPIIPTGIEAILSPRSTSTCGRNGMAIDELYDERRSLRREWIRFMDSMDSCDEDNKSDASALNDKYHPMSPRDKGETLDVELCYPTATNTNTCHLDSLFSEEYDGDDVVDEHRDEYDDKNNDDDDVFHTFRSLKEQVDRLDGILEEFSDLPNSPSTNASSPMSKSKSHTLSNKPGDQNANPNILDEPLQGRLYNECDTFEDEWDALDKLETELRKELKSVSIEMECKSYCKDSNQEQGKGKSRKDLINGGYERGETPSALEENRRTSKKSQIRKEKSSTKDKSPIAVVTVDTRSSPIVPEAQSTSAMIMDCVFNTSCTPRACSDVLEEDKEDWDAIAAHRSHFDQSIISQSQSLLSNRKKVLSPISESSLDENNCTSPLSSQSTRSDSKRKDILSEATPEVGQHTKITAVDVGMEGVLNQDEFDGTGDSSHLEENAQITSEESNSLLTESKKVTSNTTRPSPVSYTIRVPPFESKNEEKETVTLSPIESRGHTPVSYTIIVRPFSSPGTSTSPIPTKERCDIDHTTTEENQESPSKNLENDYDSRDDESHYESKFVALHSKSASTLTHDEVPPNESMNSHDAKLNEILLEDENSIRNTSVSEHQILQEILSEHDDSDDNSFLNVETSENRFSSLDAAKSPAMHLRSVSMNDENTLSSVHKDAESEYQHFNIQESPASTDGGNPFFSPNLSFELNATSDASLDLMTISVDESSLAKNGDQRSVTKEITPEQTLTASTDLTHLDIMNSESGEGDVSPLTSPVSVDDTGKDTEHSINNDIGRLYARATVGNVIVLDEGLQDSIARIKENPNHSTKSNSAKDRAHHIRAYDGIETILAEDEKSADKRELNDSCRSNSSFDLSDNTTSSLSTTSPVNGVQILTGNNDIELVPIDVSKKIDNKKAKANNENGIQIFPGDDDIEVIQLDVSAKIMDDCGLLEHEQSEHIEPVEELAFVHENVENNLLALNNSLIQAILSRNFGMFSDLTDENISGIDIQGQVVKGRTNQWETELRLRTPSEKDNDDDQFQTYNVSIEESSINELSPDVSLLIYTLLESKNDRLVNVFRETRIWKKINDEGQWLNCHVHRSRVKDYWEK